MIKKIDSYILLIATVVVFGILFNTTPATAEEGFVTLPEIVNSTVTPRIVYIENPRFPKVSAEELQKIVHYSAALVKEHFGIDILASADIPVLDIDKVFTELVENKPEKLDDFIGDFRNEKVNWEVVRKNLIKQIEKQKDPLASQIEFAQPYLSMPMEKEDIISFSHAVIETFKAGLSHWTVSKLEDGHPVIGAVTGRPDLPFNEYVYWSLMAKRGIKAEIILTNQLIASVEYIPVPLHTSIRGGITGGSTEYNPSSKYGSSVWVSLFPYFSNDPFIRKYRNGNSYTREKSLYYAGVMLAHEIGHQLLQLGHPWSNKACVMRPAGMLDFVSWVKNLDASKCPIDSSAAMKRGALNIPVW